MAFGSNSAANEAQRQRETEQAREDRIHSGTLDIRRQFDEVYNTDYYNNLKQQVKNYYGTQLNKQYAVAQQQLKSQLLRSGLGASTIGVQKNTNLDAYKTQQEGDITERATNQAQTRQADVEDAMHGVIAQLQNTGDLGAANAFASAAISAKQPRGALTPLGSVFQDFTAGLATQADMERQGTNKYNVFGRIPGWSTGGRYTQNVGS